MLTFCCPFFCTISAAFLHIFQFLSPKAGENSAEKWTAEFLLFFFYLGVTCSNNSKKNLTTWIPQYRKLKKCFQLKIILKSKRKSSNYPEHERTWKNAKFIFIINVIILTKDRRGKKQSSNKELHFLKLEKTDPSRIASKLMNFRRMLAIIYATDYLIILHNSCTYLQDQVERDIYYTQ